LFDGNNDFGYKTDGYNSNTSTIISVEFSSPTVLTHAILQGHNLKQFRLFYNSVTSNSLLTETTNSETSTYLSFSSTTVSSVQLQMDIATSSNIEKNVKEDVNMVTSPF